MSLGPVALMVASGSWMQRKRGLTLSYPRGEAGAWITGAGGDGPGCGVAAETGQGAAATLSCKPYGSTLAASTRHAEALFQALYGRAP